MSLLRWTRASLLVESLQIRCRTIVASFESLTTNGVAKTSESGIERTNLAWRIKPTTERVVALAIPAFLVVGVGLLLISIPSLLVLDCGAIIVAGFGILSLFAAFARSEKPLLHDPLPDGPEGYKECVNRLQRSSNKLERRHVYLGTIFESQRAIPALVHDKLLKMHVVCMGASGRAKTHRVAVPLSCQLLEMGRNSLVYIDLKGDDAAFRIVENTADKLGLPVYYFSLDPNEAGCLMNLLNDPAFLSFSENQQAQIVAQALGLESGEDFGAGYFGAMSEMLLKRIFHLFRVAKRPLSFATLSRFGESRTARQELGIKRRDFDNASHTLALLDKLAGDRRTNVTGGEPINPALFANAITIDKVISEPCLVYLKLPALLEPTTGRVLARLFLRILIARLMTWKAPRVDHIYCAIDECQEMLQRSLSTPLKQVRSFGLSLIFVHQNMSDLKRDGFDFTDTMMSNTAVKVMMSMKDMAGRMYLMNSSGEKIREIASSSTLKTTTPNGENVGSGNQRQQTFVDRFGQTELNYLNARQELAVLEASPMSGFTRLEQPTIIEVPFPITEKEFEEFASLGWPKPDGERSVLASDIPEDPEPPPPTLLPNPSRGPQSPPREPGAKRRRKPKPVDPEEAERAERLAETLRRLGGK